METRELSFGEKAVGRSFSPSNGLMVVALKEGFANIIDILYNLQMDSDYSDSVGVKRLAEIAITETQGAQMWAVKAATWKE